MQGSGSLSLLFLDVILLFRTLSGTHWMLLCIVILTWQWENCSSESQSPANGRGWIRAQMISVFKVLFLLLSTFCPWLPCPSPLHHPLSPINSGNVFPVPWITKTGLIVLVVLFLSLVITFLYLVAIAYLSMFFSNQTKFLEGRDWVLFITEF